MKANENCYLALDEKQKIIDQLTTKFYDILKIMKFDVDTDQQIIDTPKRIAKSWVNDLFTGCYDEEPKITVFDNDENIDSMIFLGPIDLKSMCGHHFIPFNGKCYCAYIPNNKICGISKLARIANWFMRRPQIQEELTKQIADYIEQKLSPKGVAVFIEAQHLCMISRGVEQSNSWMKTSELRGCFKEEPETRKEFFDMIQK